MSMLAFFPWLPISLPVLAGNWELAPYKRGTLPYGAGTALQKAADEILSPYVELPGQPIRSATLVHPVSSKPMGDLTEEQIVELFDLSEILAVCGISCRQYFRPALCYCNRDNFQLVVQGFSHASRHSVVTARRRDGNRMGYFGDELYQVRKPEHVTLYDIFRLDDGLLGALLDARETESWRTIKDSLVCFNLANTDSYTVLEPIECVLLVSALEGLLECKSKENELAQRFLKHSAPYLDLYAADCSHLPGLVRRKAPSSSVAKQSIRDAWIRDLWRLRGDHAHGKLKPRYKSVWSTSNHLLLGAYVYPLVLKSRLAELQLYHLTEDDHNKVDLFPSLACEDHFPVDTGHRPEDEPSWLRIEQEGIFQRIRRKNERLAQDGEKTG